MSGDLYPLWYRATDKWRQELVPKPGTKWHLLDESRSDPTRIVAQCGSGFNDIGELRDRALTERPTAIKRGELVPTPGRGAICTRCYKRALAPE